MPQNTSKTSPVVSTAAGKLKGKSAELTAGLKSLASPGKAVAGKTALNALNVKPKEKTSMTVEGANVIDLTGSAFPKVSPKQPQLPIDDSFAKLRVSQT